jgi:pimeloyl-ACP methyl ester carboxylesterase
MAAALTHHVSPSRLAYISARIPKIIIVTGDEDYLVAPKESRRLWKGMTSNDRKDMDEKKRGGPPPQDLLRVELVEFEDAGHGIHLQREEEFNKLLTRCVKEGRNLNLNMNVDLGS